MHFAVVEGGDRVEGVNKTYKGERYTLISTAAGEGEPKIHERFKEGGERSSKGNVYITRISWHG